MSIRMKMALVLLVVFALGTAALLAVVRTGYLRNVGVAAEESIGYAVALHSSAVEAAGTSGVQSTDAVLARMKSATGDEYAVIAGDAGAYDVTSATSDTLSEFDVSRLPETLEEGVNRVDITTSGASKVLLAAIPLDGEILLVERDIAGLMERMQGAPLMVIALLVVTYLVTVAAVILLLNSLVFGRLGSMTGRIEGALVNLAGGDFAGFDVQAAPTKDEFGKFEGTLYKFMQVIGATLKQMTK